MNQKLKITKLTLKYLEIPIDEKSLKKYQKIWFNSPRTKEKGGLLLTKSGFDSLSQAGFKYYEIKMDSPIVWTNEFLIWIDQNIELPFYIEKNKIWVFDEKLAIQLILFSGNIQKFQRAKKKSQLKEKIVDSEI